MIVTLAGHVDHGKTSLVHALTGVNTDRLEQEQQRGLTIDLGFAYIDDGNIGFVDVPGHHKFIHNMVAGVACHQYALLVVAADDGPMPQSREHLDILRMVGLKSGVIALTKCDQVSASRIEASEAEIADLVRGSFLQSAPIFHTSTVTPESFAPLLEHLRGKAETFEQQTSDKPFRLAIDRVFVIKGAGVVVTGTVHSGRITTDDMLVHYPTLQNVRVRGIHAQDQERTTAGTGERCAVNISGLDLDEIKRGDWLCGFEPKRVTQVSLQLATLPHFPRTIKHWTPVHVYHATSHSTGRIALLDSTAITPGTSATVDIVLDNPLACTRGDQFILRDQSLDLTLGGGEVLFAEEHAGERRRSSQRKAKLNAYARHDWRDCVADLLSTGSLDMNEVCQTWLIERETLLADLAAQHVRIIGHQAIAEHRWQAWMDVVLHHVSQSQSGIRENELPDETPVHLRQSLLNELVQQDKITHVGGVYKLPAQPTLIPEALQPLWATLQDKLSQTQTPSTGDLAKELRQPQTMLEAKMRALVKLGLLVEIATHRFYLPAQLRSIAADLAQMAGDKPFSVREFRDHAGIGRNVAIELLEYLDRRGFTRRQGNERILLRKEL